MRGVLLFVFLLSVLVSCTEISFREPQPKGIRKLESFPVSLQGKYLVPEDSATQNPDTLLISGLGYRISGNTDNSDWLNKATLGDSLILKKYKGYFFLNFYLENQWVIRPFKPSKNGDIVLYEINLSDEKNLQRLKAKLHPEILKEDSNTFYQVDPSPRDLLDFIMDSYTAQKPLRKIK